MWKSAYLCQMSRNADPEIVWSESFAEINAERFNGWIIHLICLAGSGSFHYNGRAARIGCNEAAILSHPELVSDIQSDDIRVAFVAIRSRFVYNLLPANHYGVGGGISLFENPVMPLSADDARRFLADICRIRERMDDRHYLFYDELMGSLTLTMIYDLFEFHAKLYDGVSATERTANLVCRLLSLLSAGRCKRYRKVSYYAEQLNVSAKHLSETVKHNTGRSVSYLIDRHTVPMIADYLKNSDLSLTQICEEMHFSSLSYFSRYVQKHLGMSPSAYRAAHSPVRRKV